MAPARARTLRGRCRASPKAAPASIPFQDLFQAGLGACSVDDVALSVLATVTGRQPAQDRFVIDAGGLALSKDRSTQGTAFDAGYGLVCDDRAVR